MRKSTSCITRSTLFGFENRQVDVREAVFRIVGGSALLGTKNHFMENHDCLEHIVVRVRKYRRRSGKGSRQ
jgi:hypothetical protein